MAKNCLQCGGLTPTNRSLFCVTCRSERDRGDDGQKLAHKRVKEAINDGRLHGPERMRCVDCGKPAMVYDHRDYSKPLDVEPVCRSCNIKRGRVARTRFLTPQQLRLRAYATRALHKCPKCGYVAPRIA